MTPNRIAVYLTAVAALLTALAPAIANLDLSSTIGASVGLLGLVGVVRKWLEGWQLFEERVQAGRGELIEGQLGSFDADPTTPPGLAR